MSGELMRAWRGDHTRLLVLVADQLTTAELEVAAEAAAVLDSCHPIAGPAREALAAHIDAQRAAHGSDVWAASEARLRRSHQEAVRALARLGDARALPSVLAALVHAALYSEDVDPAFRRRVENAAHAQVGSVPDAADQGEGVRTTAEFVRALQDVLDVGERSRSRDPRVDLALQRLKNVVADCTFWSHTARTA